MEVIKKYLSSFICLKKGLVLSLSKGQAVFILALLFLGIFVPTKFAYAFGFGDLLGPLVKIFDVLLGIASGVVWIKLGLSLFTITVAFIPVLLSALFLNFVLSDYFITTGIGYTYGGVVDIGWDITRDIANLSFIAILLVIAISTMLGQEKRGVKALLPKLIGIALLVNFTKVIAGVVVDLANIITNYFLSPITNIGNLFLEIFAQGSPAWQAVGGFMALIKDPSIGAIFNFLVANVSYSSLISDTISAIMITIVSVLMAFTLLVFAFIFILRYVAIWLLVILSPLAFAAMILPDTAKFARQWWQSLIKWSFIGVMPAFILFITAKMIKAKNEMFSGEFQESALGGGFVQDLLSPLYNIWNEIIFWLVILIFMWMALMSALKMNDKFASITMKYGRKAVGAAAGWAKGAALKRYGGAIQGAGAKIAGSKYAKGRITGGLFRATGKKVEELGRADEKSWKDEEEKAKKRSKYMNRALLQATNDPREYNAALKALQETDSEKVEEMLKTPEGEKKFRNMTSHLSRTQPGREKGLLAIAPHFADSSNNVKIHDADTNLQQEVEEAKRDPTKTQAEREKIENAARVKSYARHMSKEKAKNANAAALKDANYIAGIMANKDVDLFDDVLTTSQKIANSREGYKALYPDKWAGEFAKSLKDKHIPKLGTLLEGDEGKELIAAWAKIKNKVSWQTLQKIIDNQGEEIGKKFIKEFQAMSVDELSKEHYNLVKSQAYNPAAQTLLGSEPLMDPAELARMVKEKREKPTKEAAEREAAERKAQEQERQRIRSQIKDRLFDILKTDPTQRDSNQKTTMMTSRRDWGDEIVEEVESEIKRLREELANIEQKKQKELLTTAEIQRMRKLRSKLYG